MKTVPYIGGGYQGMNPRAGRELHIKCPPRTILLQESLAPSQRRKILRHERKEYRLMGPPRRLKYAQAHRLAG